MDIVQPSGHQLYPFSSSSTVVICPRQHVRNRTSHVHTIQNIAWAVATERNKKLCQSKWGVNTSVWHWVQQHHSKTSLFAIMDIVVHTSSLVQDTWDWSRYPFDPSPSLKIQDTPDEAAQSMSGESSSSLTFTGAGAGPNEVQWIWPIGQGLGHVDLGWNFWEPVTT